MNRVSLTMDLPCALDAKRHDSATPTAFTGFQVGPFFCHHAVSDDESVLMGDYGQVDYGDWNITHIGTGFVVQKALATAFRAIWLAERLLEINPMEGDSVEVIRDACAGFRPQIDVLRFDAMNGDCQGACAGVVQPLAEDLQAAIEGKPA